MRIAHFVPNFVARATGVGRGKCNWQHSMAHPRKPPCRRKNIAKISCASRVIAHSVPNFVAMATRGRGRERGKKMGKGKRKKNGVGTTEKEGQGEGEGKGRERKMGKGKGKGKRKGRWKEDSLRNVGRTDGRTDGHKGDFILQKTKQIITFVKIHYGAANFQSHVSAESESSG